MGSPKNLGSVAWTPFPNIVPGAMGPNPVVLSGGLFANAEAGADRITGTGDQANGQAVGALFDNSTFYLGLGSDLLEGTGSIGANGTNAGTNGGNGVNTGANGANGANGRFSFFRAIRDGKPGQNGDAGGKGDDGAAGTKGDDGLAGTKGAVGIKLTNNSLLDTGPQLKILGVDLDVGGNDTIIGKGGAGGAGGLGGRNGFFASRAASGSGGSAGNAGATGTAGSNGDAGDAGKRGVAIWNDGTVLTGFGNDTVDGSLGGFDGSGVYRLDRGNDTVKGFGNATFRADGGFDTLNLPGASGDYTIGSILGGNSYAKDGMTQVEGVFHG